MLTATVNKKIFEIEPKAMLVNKKPFSWDIIEVKENTFHILYNNFSYNATVVHADYTTKSFLIEINKKTYTIEVKDRFDSLLDQMGISSANSIKVQELKAPMPGLIVAIQVAVGDTVKKGDNILILEAMKMENILKSPTEGKIKDIKVVASQNVDKNAILVSFE